PEARIALDLMDGACSVRGDVSILKRIFWLLGWHSVSAASAAKPQITITTRVVGNKCLLTWHDNGPTVADVHAERLFEPFQPVGERWDNFSLPLVRLLARRLRGYINATPAPAGGMDFTLELALA